MGYSGGDIILAVRDFFEHGKLLKELNHTVIVLIPKVASPARINDYRPISLCNVIFKCISKIIANRVKNSLKLLVSNNQSAFVPGRRISDNILLTQELLHNYHLDRGPPRCAFKVDIQKAYDTVDWNFLREILLGFGFHTRMVSWIMECVSTTSFSVCVNGELHGWFEGRRGLRQGDPLSPYLFTLVMEILTLMLQRKITNSEEFLFHKRCDDLRIINLCFADDLFIFAHGDALSVKVIWEALEEFKNVSGLSTSLPKSTAFFCNVLNHTKLEILSILPFEEGRLPVKYLGVPLVSTRLGYRECKELVERVQKRVSDWKNKFLSFAGRLQLVQSVISSMHVYWSSVFILPSRILLEIEQIMRGFLWCQGGMARGKAKVAWESVCLPKKEGGLGLRRLAGFNVALITSHIWSIISLKESLWVKWIHMYKLKGRSFWEIPFRGNMTWSWRKLLQTRPLVRRCFWHKIGNGSSIFAWHDNWCGNGPLSNEFSARQISSMGFRMDAKVSDLALNGEGSWPSAWAGRFSNVPFPCIIDDKVDEVVWKDRNGTEKDFSVGVAWNDLRSRGLEVGWFNLVWFSHSIPRHAFLLWLTFKRKLKTQDLLRQWDISGVDPSMLTCPLCRLQQDSHDHLFFECSFSSQVWSKVKVKVNLHLVSSSWSSIVNGILPSAKKRSLHGIAAKLVLAASVYYIWQERNARLFQRNSRTHEQLVNVILSTVRMKLLSFKYKETRRWEEFRAEWELPPSILMGRKT